MALVGILFTHALAERQGKLPFFFSRFNFDRMKELGNTHYCFYCLGKQGFKPGDKLGEIKNNVDENGYDGMSYHDESHAVAIIGNADKYKNVYDWLAKETPENFPCLIHVPNV